MRQSSRTGRTTLLMGGFAIAAAMAACGGSVPPLPVVPTVPTITTLPSLDEMLSEKIQGSTSAANTIIEYVSFYSAGSKDFYLTGDGAQMKSQLADTGRAQIWFRNLFLLGAGEGSGSAGKPVAAMLARCAGNARFFDAVTKLFQSQPSWSAASDPDVATEQVMLGFGMSQSLINSCLGSTALLNGLGQIHTNALQQTYQLPDGTQRVGTSTTSSILAVPALVVNGVLFDGRNSDGTTNAAFAPTVANIQASLR